MRSRLVVDQLNLILTVSQDTGFCIMTTFLIITIEEYYVIMFSVKIILPLSQLLFVVYTRANFLLFL